MDHVLHNGYPISKLTLGTVQLGIPYGINNTHGMPDYRGACDILSTAHRLGVRSFDTAGSYGKSEETLGRFFAENPVEKTIITKLELDEGTTDLEKAVLARIQRSCDRLQLQKLPILMLHTEKYVLEYGKPLLFALKRAKNEGLIGGIGLSFSDKSDLIPYLADGDFDCIQIPANMFDNKEIKNGTLALLEKEGIAVFVRSVYLQGLFFKDPDTLPEKIRSAKPVLQALQALAAEQGIGMAQLAMSYMKNATGITSLVLGCDTPSQLEESVSLLDAPALSATLCDRIHALSEQIAPSVIRPWEWH